MRALSETKLNLKRREKAKLKRREIAILEADKYYRKACIERERIIKSQMAIQRERNDLWSSGRFSKSYSELIDSSLLRSWRNDGFGPQPDEFGFYSVLEMRYFLCESDISALPPQRKRFLMQYRQGRIRCEIDEIQRITSKILDFITTRRIYNV